MSTLKLNKSPATPESNSAEAPAKPAARKPVRAAAPELRDRSKPPAKKPVPMVKENPAQRTGKDHATNGEKVADRKAHADSAPRGKTQERGGQRAPRDMSNARRSSSAQSTPRSAGKPAQQARPNREQMEGREYAPRQTSMARTVTTATPNAESSLPRLSKVMADRGLCSRREADDWIVNGWVKVNGEIVDTLGTRIAPDAEIIISTYAKEHQAENVTILLHKPIGYVSGQAEDGYEPAVVLVTPDNQWSEDPTQKPFRRGFLHGLAPAGRLDIDSTGLLVLTQDGRIARKLIGDDSSTEKEYLVRVEGELSANGLAKLNHGLSLDGVQLKPAKVSWQNEHQLRFVLREGRKRQIRRMCELVGLKVVGLKRIRIGRIALGKLPPGQWRYLGEHERF